jgi:hypothetical protein
MPRRDETEQDDYEERPRRRPSREEPAPPAKPRRPARAEEQDDEEEEDRPRRRRPREEEDEDEEERRPAKRRRPRDDDDYDDDDDRPRKGRGIESIIPYHNGMALASYYCSFGGLIAIFGALAWFAFTAPNPNRTLYMILMAGGGGLFALLSVVFGIIGLIKSRRNRKARGTAHAIIGLLLGGCEGGAVVVLMVLKPFLAVAGFM